MSAPDKPRGAMLFYAEGRRITKRSVETENEDGSRNFTLSFPVCEVSEWVEPETVATALHHAEATIPQLRAALHEAEEYFEGRADAEYLPGQAAPQGNEEMTLLCDIRAALALANEPADGDQS